MQLGFIILPILIFYCSCASSKPSASQASAKVTEAAGAKHVILTLVLKASWNSDSTEHFEVYNDIRNEGVLKQKKIRTFDAAYVISFSDMQGNKLDSAFISDPLQEKIETENEQKKLVTSIFKQQEAFTDVRVNYLPEMKRIEIRNLLSNKIQTINLQ